MVDTIGRYELEERVAEGALATLWRARQTGDAGYQRPVAIRDVSRALAKDRSFVSSWAAIASELAEAPSPHVEQIVDVVIELDRVLLVSEWIEGVSLTRWIAAQGAAAPGPLAVEIAIEALRGLADAHARTPPLTHDGLAPASVRIARDGTVKLTRFGVAGALGAIGLGRRKMEEMGVRHPAPELVAGEAPEPATDLFGVGALIFEMLTGRPAYEGEPSAERDLRVTGEPPDLARARPDVPPLLVALVERAMRLEAGERFASSAEMARALAQLLRSHPEPTGPEVLAASLSSLDAAPAAREPRDEDAEDGAGAAALAASVQAMLGASAQKKRPQGLAGTEQRTMHVDTTELIEVSGRAEGAPAEIVPSEPPPADEEKPRRYRFDKKERTASASAERAKTRPPEQKGLEPQDSEAEPLPLVPKRPKGLSPAKTELLDEDQVDRLTLPDAVRPRPKGLSPAKTEFLDEDQVDQLKIDEE